VLSSGDAVGGLTVTTETTAPIKFGVNATEVGSWTSTGLAVTGGVSATGTIGTSNALEVLNGKTAYFHNTGSTLYYTQKFGASGLGWGYNGAADSMTLDASGNLGLGVSSVSSAISGSAKVLGICDSTTTNLASIRLGSGSTFASGSRMEVFSSGGACGLYGESNVPMTFATNGAERARIDASGNLLVGTTSTSTANVDSVRITALGGNASYGAAVGIDHGSNGVSGSGFMSFQYNTSNIGTISQNGTTSVAYNTTSDHRLKENVRPANAARFKDIQFRDFEWVDGRHDCGVIAHELQEVYPDLVLGDKDAVDDDGKPVYQQVNYTGLICRMGAVIQQLEARLAALEAK
jgi:hypothetical protein